MEVIAQLRNSFRRTSSAPSLGTATTTPTATTAASPTASPIDTNNNNQRAHSTLSKHKTRHSCGICGKRLVKIGGWKNFFTLPCRCRHMFCKQCITGRLACRQKVLRSPDFSEMWTFPCPGQKECQQQLTVDWSRGSSYSKNLVAHDFEDADSDPRIEVFHDNFGIPLDNNLAQIKEVSEAESGSIREYG